jgi:phage protein D
MANGAAVLVNGTKDDDLSTRAHVTVEQGFGEPASFLLRLPLDAMKGDYPALSDGRLGPGASITVVAETGSARACLIHGPVCGQHIAIARGGAGNVLEVHGADESIKLDRVDKTKVFSATTDSQAASEVLNGAGITPDAESTKANHAEDGRALVQAETDLQFLLRLAERNGYLLWFSSTEQGKTTGHFKPAQVSGKATRLSIEGDGPAFERLEIDWDVERPTAATAKASDSHGTSPIGSAVTKSPIEALGTQAFAKVAGAERSVRLAYPADKGDELTARANAAVVQGSWFATATGQTTAARAKAILLPGSLVELQGVGKPHSGNWLCSRVRHDFSAIGHSMELTMIRNGWGTA